MLIAKFSGEKASRYSSCDSKRWRRNVWKMWKGSQV